MPPGEEVYYRFARGKKNHAYTNKHASEINEGDGGSGGWIMHLENIPKECDESNFGLATLTSASGYTTPTLDFFGHEVGGNDYHASKGDWDWKTGTFHEGFPVNKKCAPAGDIEHTARRPAAPSSAPPTPPPPSTTQPSTTAQVRRPQGAQNRSAETGRHHARARHGGGPLHAELRAA